MSIVSKNIKYLRKLNGFTQEKLAQKIGIKRSLVGAYEESRANPNLANLKNMAIAFGTTVDKILEQDLSNQSEISDKIENSLLQKNKSVPKARKMPLQSTTNHTKVEIPIQTSISDRVRHNLPATAKPVHDSNPETKKPFQPHENFHKLENPQPYTILNHALPTIQWVSKALVPEYLLQYQNPLFLTQLPTFQLPNLPKGYFRAFEIGQDFTFPGSLLVGTFVRNWFDIEDGGQYIFVLLGHGVIFRTAHNQNVPKGKLILKSNLHTIADQTISLSDVLEVWQVKAFVSLQLPQPIPSIDRVSKLVHELQEEVNKLL
jgi:transcriptional regulator with XRE-family HTH domain